MHDLTPEPLVFSGLDGATGDYLHPPITADELTGAVYGPEVEAVADAHLRDLVKRAEREEPAYAVAYPAKPEELDQAGWGIVTAAGASPERLTALEPLCSLRREQVGELFKIFTGEKGVRPNDSADAWLGRRGMGDSDAEPEKVPYYLLLVGGPEEISFEFQYELDVTYAVGRVSFDEPEGYGSYAEAVVAAEGTPRSEPPTVALFGPQNPDDRATSLSATHLLEPLGAEVGKTATKPFTLSATIGERADKASLRGLLWGEAAPDVLFTASHGIGFTAGHQRQLAAQGALVCQDWPGPVAWKKKPLSEDFYVCAADAPDDVQSSPPVVFAFACYGAGTPRLDDFGHLRRKNARELAKRPFVARLPQQLLTGAGGHTLAFIGHIERAWECSFISPDAGAQRGPFVSTLATILDGWRVGHALEVMNSRYARRAATLARTMDKYAKSRVRIKPAEMAELWVATNDARNYAVLGDPAVRLPRPA